MAHSTYMHDFNKPSPKPTDQLKFRAAVGKLIVVYYKANQPVASPVIRPTMSICN